MRSGLFMLRQTDLFVKDVMPLCLTRTYRPRGAQIRALGMGTNHPYELTEYGSRFAYVQDRMTTISDEKGSLLLEIDYDEYGRVQEERVGDGARYRFRYTRDQNNRGEEALVTVPSGTVYTFDHGTLVPPR
jgi:hypothetical protein